MAVLLNRAYAGSASGATVQLPATTEAALIAQGLASSAAASTITVGAATANTWSGRAAIGAGASSVVITNLLVDANSQVFAVVAQAAADGTLLRVERVVPAAGSFTIFGTANATATTFVNWMVARADGGLTSSPV
ncbi:MAG: hypothetical protein ACREVZ_15910 [Burkholderiales bacterium]